MHISRESAEQEERALSGGSWGRACQQNMPASTELEDAGSISHSVIILLCDLGQELTLSGPLFFFFSKGTDGRHKGAGSQAIREGGSLT